MPPERQHVKRSRLTLILAVAAGTLGACAGRPVADAPARGVPTAESSVDRELALLTFDSAWSRIAHTHYDTAYGGVDWAAVHAELRPQAAAAATIGELRAVLETMLRRLGESHFGLIPREVTDVLTASPRASRFISGNAGLEVRLVGDELLVWRIRPDAAAVDAGVRTGWAIVAVDGRPVAPRIAALAGLTEAERRVARTTLLYQVNAEFAGDIGSTVAVTFRDEEGAEVERTIELRQAGGQVEQFGNLPPVLASLEHSVLPAGEECVGVIRLNYWMATLASAFDRAVDEMRHCRGVVVDLRGNPGGVAAMVMGTAGHFLNDTLVLGYMTQRTTTLRLKANPRRVRGDGTFVEPFAGRLAILIDETSASTSEFFAASLQALGRARVFGSPSAGQALPALMVRLPTGDVLMHVVANFTGPRNVRIEGQGVVPDVPVSLTRQDLLAGRDMPMKAALDWITGTAAAGHHVPGGRRP
jgi:carboxyl-terminal processing protease